MKQCLSIFSLGLLAQVVVAQSYTGTYTGTAAGQPITLSIQQDAQGNVSGTFLAADGRQYQLQGVPADQGAISGRMADAQGQASFGAALDGEMLVLYIIPWQADGQPDYNAAQELVLQRQGGGISMGVGFGQPTPGLGSGGEPGGGAPAELAGTYSGSVQGTPVTLTLAQQGTGLQGELVDNTGYRYTLSGTVQGSAGSGTLSDPQTGGTMQFEVAAQGNGLALTLIVQDPNTGQMNRIPLQFQRGGAAPSQPPAGGMSGGMSTGYGGSTTGAGSVAPVTPGGPPPAGMMRTSTATGLVVDYPAGWQVHPGGAAVSLIPVDARRDAQGQPLELIVAGYDGPATGHDPAAPDLVARMDRQFQMMGLHRVAGPEQAPASGLGPAVVLTYEGSPAGMQIRQRTYLTVHDRRVYYLSLMARSDLIARREADAHRVLSSFALGEPKRDPNLVGSWGRETTSGSSDPVVGSVYASNASTITFMPDGRVVENSSGTVTGSVPGLDAMYEGAPTSDQGRWYASDGQLVIELANGTVGILLYSIFPHQGTYGLKLQRSPNDKPTYYTRR